MTDTCHPHRNSHLCSLETRLLVLPLSQHTNLHPQALLQQPVLQNPCQAYRSGWWVLAKQGFPVAGFAVGLCHSVERGSQGAGTFKGGVLRRCSQPRTRSKPHRQRRRTQQSCFIVWRDCPVVFWHARFAGFTTTSCVGGICLVVNFSQILSESDLVRGLRSIARRLG